MIRRDSSSVNDDDVKIEHAVKIALLGEGSQGLVWSVRMKKRPRSYHTYALKQRLVRRRDASMSNTKTSSVLRELEFYKRVANRFPGAFSRLYDWELVEATPELKEQISVSDDYDAKERGEYTHVFTTLTDKKEGILKSIYRELNKAQWLSMFAQVCHAIAILEERGFSHDDIWEANVAFNRIPWAREVPIFRGSVPSLGYIWSIIDYGNVQLMTDYEGGKSASVRKRRTRASSEELDDMISLASGEDDAIKVCGVAAMDEESAEFRKQVLNSIDGPSVRVMMRKTGLPVHMALALLNLDAYVWHSCGKARPDSLKQWLDRGALLQLADARASYAALATSFARLTREAVKRGEGGSRIHENTTCQNIWECP